MVTVFLAVVTSGSESHCSLTTYAGTATPEVVARSVPHFKVYRCFNKPGQVKMSRLELIASGDSFGVVTLLEDYVKIVGGRRCVGKAPRGFRERELANSMGNLKLWTKTNRSAESSEDDEDLSPDKK